MSCESAVTPSLALLHFFKSGTGIFWYMPGYAEHIDSIGNYLYAKYETADPVIITYCELVRKHKCTWYT